MQKLLLHSNGDVAQLGERGVRNAEAEGSNPFISTRTFGTPSVEGVFFCAWPVRGFEPVRAAQALVACAGRSAEGAEPWSVGRQANAANPFISTRTYGTPSAEGVFFCAVGTRTPRNLQNRRSQKIATRSCTARSTCNKKVDSRGTIMNPPS